jgi:uncharacterized membrane protein YfcA
MYRRTFNRGILATMIPGAAVGVLLAFAFASILPAWSVEIVLGIVSLLFSLQQLKRQLGTPLARRPIQGGTRLLGMMSGIGSGFTSAIAHAGTPPFQFYVMPRGLDRDMYVGTSVLFFAATNVMKAPAFIALGQLSVAQLKTTLILLPLAVASSWAGVRLVQMIDVRKFNTVISIILLGVSVTLVCQGVAGFRGL